MSAPILIWTLSDLVLDKILLSPLPPHLTDSILIPFHSQDFFLTHL
jgi:hypothetical protein